MSGFQIRIILPLKEHEAYGLKGLVAQGNLQAVWGTKQTSYALHGIQCSFKTVQDGLVLETHVKYQLALMLSFYNHCLKLIVCKLPM